MFSTKDLYLASTICLWIQPTKIDKTNKSLMKFEWSELSAEDEDKINQIVTLYRNNTLNVNPSSLLHAQSELRKRMMD